MAVETMNHSISSGRDIRNIQSCSKQSYYSIRTRLLRDLSSHLETLQHETQHAQFP